MALINMLGKGGGKKVPGNNEVDEMCNDVDKNIGKEMLGKGVNYVDKSVGR